MDDSTSRIFVSGGIAEVNPASCTILAEQVIDLNTISRADVQDRLAKAKLQLENALEEEATRAARKEMELAEAVLAAL